MEYKRLDLQTSAIKAEGESMTFEGYASMFNGIDSYGDTIRPGAYAKTLENRSRPIRLRWNHFGPVIGKFEEIREDEYGLFVKGSLTPEHSVASDVYASLKHGAVDGMSIGYRVKDDEMEGNIRVLKEIELIEISVVEEPADLGATVDDVKDIKELIGQIESPRDAERFMREACGFSRVHAKSFVSRIKRLCEGGHDPESTVSGMLMQRIGNK